MSRQYALDGLCHIICNMLRRVSLMLSQKQITDIGRAKGNPMSKETIMQFDADWTETCERVRNSGVDLARIHLVPMYRERKDDDDAPH